MTYALVLCLGMTWGLCNQYKVYEYTSLSDCEKQKLGVSQRAIGDGYAICVPNRKDAK